MADADFDTDDTPTPQEQALAQARALLARNAISGIGSASGAPSSSTPQPPVAGNYGQLQIHLPEMSAEDSADLGQREKFGNLETLIGGSLAPLGQQDLRSVQAQRSLYSPYKAALAQAALARAGTGQQRADDYGKDVDSRVDKREQPKVQVAGDKETGYLDPQTHQWVSVVDAPPPKPQKLFTGKGGGAVDPATEAMIERAARDYNGGAGLPSLAGAQGTALKARILKKASELAGPGAQGVGLATAGYKADAGSLHHVQQQADAVNSFTRTFDKNSNILEESLGKLSSSNSPFANKGLRWLEKNATGDPNYTAFANSLNTVRSELGKINSGSTGAGGVPISVLEEMQHGLPEDATPAQVMAALRVYRKDSENRRAAMQEQVDEIHARMGGKPTGGTGGSAAPAPAASPVSARIQALIQSGVTDKAAIKAQLKKEGLVP